MAEETRAAGAASKPAAGVDADPLLSDVARLLAGADAAMLAPPRAFLSGLTISLDVAARPSFCQMQAGPEDRDCSTLFAGVTRLEMPIGRMPAGTSATGASCSLPLTPCCSLHFSPNSPPVAFLPVASPHTSAPLTGIDQA